MRARLGINKTKSWADWAEEEAKLIKCSKSAAAETAALTAAVSAAALPAAAETAALTAAVSAAAQPAAAETAALNGPLSERSWRVSAADHTADKTAALAATAAAVPAALTAAAVSAAAKPSTLDRSLIHKLQKPRNVDDKAEACVTARRARAERKLQSTEASRQKKEFGALSRVATFTKAGKRLRLVASCLRIMRLAFFALSLVQSSLLSCKRLARLDHRSVRRAAHVQHGARVRSTPAAHAHALRRRRAAARAHPHSAAAARAAPHAPRRRPRRRRSPDARAGRAAWRARVRSTPAARALPALPRVVQLTGHARPWVAEYPHGLVRHHERAPQAERRGRGHLVQGACWLLAALRWPPAPTTRLSLPPPAPTL